jgi:hypothetical protein
MKSQYSKDPRTKDALRSLGEAGRFAIAHPSFAEKYNCEA